MQQSGWIFPRFTPCLRLSPHTAHHQCRLFVACMRINQFIPKTFDFLLRFGIELADILIRIIHSIKAFSVHRNQIVDTVYFVQREIGVNSMSTWRNWYQPSAAYSTFQPVSVERIGSVHNEFEVVESSPFAVTDSAGCTLWVHFIKSRIHAILFRAFKIVLPALFWVWRFRLSFHNSHFPLAKGERGKTDVYIAVFYRGNFLLMLLMDMGEICVWFAGIHLPLYCFRRSLAIICNRWECRRKATLTHVQHW